MALKSDHATRTPSQMIPNNKREGHVRCILTEVPAAKLGLALILASLQDLDQTRVCRKMDVSQALHHIVDRASPLMSMLHAGDTFPCETMP